MVLEAGYGLNTLLNGVKPDKVLRAGKTIMACDAGVNDTGRSNAGTYITATHLYSPGRSGSNGLGRPNPRHPNQSCSVARVDGHATALKLEWTPDNPFYPTAPGVSVITPNTYNSWASWRPAANLNNDDPSVRDGTFAGSTYNGIYLDSLWDLY